MQPSTPNKPTTTRASSTPEASAAASPATESARTQGLAALAEVLRTHKSAGFATELTDVGYGEAARVLLDVCLASGRLDLTQMRDEIFQEVVWGMPAQAWACLGRVARDINGAGIHSVELGAMPAGATFAHLAKGLNQLPDLADLGLRQPTTGTVLDLRALRPPAQGIAVRLCEPDPKLREVLAHRGVTVHLGAQVDWTVHRVRVHHRSSDSKTRQVVDLDAAPYFRRSDALSPRTASDEAHQTQLGSISTNHNTVAVFRQARSLLAPSIDEPIACRHLATHWLHARQAYHLARAQPGGAKLRFSYADFATPDAIARAVPLAVPAQYTRIEGTSPIAIFSQQHLGKVLAKECARMGAGDVRRYALINERHVMAIELHTKASHHPGEQAARHALLFFDPNSTTTHLRLIASSPEKLAGLRLDQLMRKAHFLDEYCAGSEHRIFTLTEVRDGHDVRTDPPAMNHLDAGSMRSPQYFHALMRSHGAAHALISAINAVLSDAELDSPQRAAILSATLSLERHLSPAAHSGLRTNPKVITRFVRAVLEAPATALALPDKLALVIGNRADGTSLLHSALGNVHRAESADIEKPELASAVASLYGIVHEIAVSPYLTLAQKEIQLCAGRSWRAVLMASPLGARTMAEAIVDARLDPASSSALLELARIPWRFGYSAPQAAKTAADAKSAVAGDARTIGHGKPAAVSMTGMPAQHFADAGFRILHADSHRDYMVCTSEHAIDAIAYMRLQPGTRLGRDSSFPGIRYLVPKTQLVTAVDEARTADTKASASTTPAKPPS